MSQIPNLGPVVDRFNQGCSFFAKALKSWSTGKLPEYENSLRKCATEAIGGLEWALKVYLRSMKGHMFSEEDRSSLKQPTFDTLMGLMQTYADPPLDADTISLFYQYRDLYRNPAEHDASVPLSTELHEALLNIRRFLGTYLAVKDAQLRDIPPLSPDDAIDQLRRKYFETLRCRYEYMDFGGISPRIGSKIVKIRMDEVFISVAP